MLCDERHFARAAGRLGISPPSLTRKIQTLEAKVGARLLDRKAKSQVIVTEAGLRFLGDARDVLARAQEAVRRAHQAARGEIGKVEVGYVMAAVYSGLVQRLIRAFQQDHPGIEAGFHECGNIELMNRLISKSLDIAFSRLPRQLPPELAGFPVHSAPLVLAMPASHPLAGSKRPIDPRLLADAVFVSTSPDFDMAFKSFLETIVDSLPFKPKIGRRAESIAAALAYVSAGQGMAPVSKDLARCQMPDVVYKDIAWDGRFKIYCVHRVHEDSPAVKVLIEAIRRHEIACPGGI